MPLTAAFVVGLSMSLSHEVIAVLVAIAALAAAFVLERHVRSRFATPVVLLAFVLLGAGARGMASRALARNPMKNGGFEAADACLESPCLLEGSLHAEPERELPTLRQERPRVASLLLDVRSIRVGRTRRETSGTVRLTVPDSAGRLDPLEAGDRVSVWARLKSARGFWSPGSFDVEAYYARREIALTGSVKSPLVIERSARAPWLSPGAWGSRVRALVRRRLASAFSDATSRDEAPGVLLAMLVGDRAWIPPWADELYQQSGTLHVIAISGAHVAFLAFVVYRALRFLGLGEVATLRILAGILPAYGFLCGSAPSVVRAVLMGLAFVGARLLSLDTSGLGVLGASALVLLAARPLDLADPGFQLSFAATASLLALGPGPERRVNARAMRLWTRLRRLFTVSVAAQAGVIPIVAWHFSRLSLGAIVANVVAVPASAGLLVGGMALVLVEPLPVIGALTAHIVSGLVMLLTLASRWAVAIPGGALRVPSPSPIWMVGYAAGLIVVLVTRGNWRRTASGFLLLWIALLALKPDPEPARHLELTAIDVGHGDALLLELPRGPRILVDTGGSFDPSFDVGDKVVVPFLLHKGIRRLHAVILTHPDRDHVGGLDAVLSNLDVDEVWTGRFSIRDGARRVKTRTLREGERLDFGESAIEVLAASETHPARSANAASLVLRVVYGEASLLLTGDAERSVEQMLLTSGRPLQSTILKVGHHGSRSSSFPLFLDAVRPRLAIVSVGSGRHPALPSPEVLARLRSRNVETYRTDRDGTIFATLQNNGEYTVETWASLRRRQP